MDDTAIFLVMYNVFNHLLYNFFLFRSCFVMFYIGRFKFRFYTIWTINFQYKGVQGQAQVL